MSDEEVTPNAADLTIAEIRAGLEAGLWTIEEVIADESATDHPRKGVLALAQAVDTTSDKPGSDLEVSDLEGIDPEADSTEPESDPEDEPEATVEAADEADDLDVPDDEDEADSAPQADDHPLMTLPAQSRHEGADPFEGLPVQSRPEWAR